MNASFLVNAVGWTLVQFVWQGALIGCATAVGLIALRNARPERRYLLACSALVVCLLWPAFELWHRVHDLHAASVPETGVARLALQGAGSAGTSWFEFVQDKLASIVLTWAACAVALAVRMALGLLWIGRAARQGHSDRQWQARLDHFTRQFAITRAVRLRVVDDLQSPVTAGWWRPVVLVPASLVTGMAPDLLEALLAHEIAHVKRFDYLVNLGQNVIETLLFYHPAVWWISRQIRTTREQIADDMAARLLGEPRRLALALSELEKIQFSTHHLAQAANGGDLMSRIKRLVRPDTQALNWKAAIPVLGLIAGCSALQPAAEPPKPNVTIETAATTPAVVDFRSCGKPKWPSADLAAQHQGAVKLTFLVGKEGNVIDSKVVASSGYPDLDEAARHGIAQCHFRPATINNAPAESWANVQYVWTLK